MMIKLNSRKIKKIKKSHIKLPNESDIWKGNSRKIKKIKKSLRKLPNESVIWKGESPKIITIAPNDHKNYRNSANIRAHAINDIVRGINNNEKKNISSKKSSPKKSSPPKNEINKALVGDLFRIAVELVSFSRSHNSNNNNKKFDKKGAYENNKTVKQKCNFIINNLTSSNIRINSNFFLRQNNYILTLKRIVLPESTSQHSTNVRKTLRQFIQDVNELKTREMRSMEIPPQIDGRFSTPPPPSSPTHQGSTHTSPVINGGGAYAVDGDVNISIGETGIAPTDGDDGAVNINFSPASDPAVAATAAPAPAPVPAAVTDHPDPAPVPVIDHPAPASEDGSVKINNVNINIAETPLKNKIAPVPAPAPVPAAVTDHPAEDGSVNINIAETPAHDAAAEFVDVDDDDGDGDGDGDDDHPADGDGDGDDDHPPAPEDGSVNINIAETPAPAPTPTPTPTPAAASAHNETHDDDAAAHDAHDDDDASQTGHLDLKITEEFVPPNEQPLASEESGQLDLEITEEEQCLNEPEPEPEPGSDSDCCKVACNNIITTYNIFNDRGKEARERSERDSGTLTQDDSGTLTQDASGTLTQDDSGTLTQDDSDIHGAQVAVSIAAANREEEVGVIYPVPPADGPVVPFPPHPVPPPHHPVPPADDGPVVVFPPHHPQEEEEDSDDDDDDDGPVYKQKRKKWKWNPVKKEPGDVAIKIEKKPGDVAILFDFFDEGKKIMSFPLETLIIDVIKYVINESEVVDDITDIDMYIPTFKDNTICCRNPNRPRCESTYEAYGWSNPKEYDKIEFKDYNKRLKDYGVVRNNIIYVKVSSEEKRRLLKLYIDVIPGNMRITLDVYNDTSLIQLSNIILNNITSHRYFLNFKEISLYSGRHKLFCGEILKGKVEGQEVEDEADFNYGRNTISNIGLGGEDNNKVCAELTNTVSDERKRKIITSRKQESGKLKSRVNARMLRSEKMRSYYDRHSGSRLSSKLENVFKKRTDHDDFIEAQIRDYGSNEMEFGDEGMEEEKINRQLNLMDLAGEESFEKRLHLQDKLNSRNIKSYVDKYDEDQKIVRNYRLKKMADERAKDSVMSRFKEGF
jgi:hypothetical protein